MEQVPFPKSSQHGSTSRIIKNLVHTFSLAIRVECDPRSATVTAAGMSSGAAWCASDAEGMIEQFGRIESVGGCTDVRLGELLAQVSRTTTSPVFVDVGANKGYKLAEFLGLWTDRNITNAKWGAAVRRYGQSVGSGYLAIPQQACGNCADCAAHPPQPHQRRGGMGHALELSPVNCKMLRAVVTDMQVSDLVHVHCIGAFNQSGRLWVPAIPTGYEGASVGDRRTHGMPRLRAAGNGEWVGLQTVDQFLQEHEIDSVSHIAIDTEGYDALVLEGMHSTLRSQRVGTIEFEYSGKGSWALQAREPRTLQTTLKHLELYGYRCYLQSRHSLLPASGPCWRDGFEFRGWSNVLCAHEPHVLTRLDTFAAHGWRQRRDKCTTPESPYVPRKGQAFVTSHGAYGDRILWARHCPRAPPPHSYNNFSLLKEMYYPGAQGSEAHVPPGHTSTVTSTGTQELVPS